MPRADVMCEHSRVEYWYADLVWGIRPSRRQPEVREAPARWEVPGVDAPEVGDRVVFRGRGPVTGNTRPACRGLAEVTGVAVDNGVCVVAFRTVLRGVIFFHRGDESSQVGEWIASIPRTLGRWQRLGTREAEAMFQLIATEERELVPPWFTIGGLQVDALPEFDPAQCVDARARRLRLIVERRGRPEFRDTLLAAYERACAMSGCDVESVLEAAHIFPYAGPASNHVQNGLLLRADLHTLFDADLVTVDPDTYVIAVDETLRASEYGHLHGRGLRIPRSADQQPSRHALRARLR
jgi:hypothetical protein